MNQNLWIRQMIDFNRTALENALNTMTLIQEQAEITVNGCFDRATWLPKAGRTVVDEWMKACKNGRESFKSAMHESFSKVDAFFINFPKGE